MKNQPYLDLIDDALAGKIRHDLAQRALQAIGVYGAFRSHAFMGFDYMRGQHIERSRPVFQRGPIVIAWRASS